MTTNDFIGIDEVSAIRRIRVPRTKDLRWAKLKQQFNEFANKSVRDKTSYQLASFLLQQSLRFLDGNYFNVHAPKKRKGLYSQTH